MPGAGHVERGRPEDVWPGLEMKHIACGERRKKLIYADTYLPINNR